MAGKNRKRKAGSKPKKKEREYARKKGSRGFSALAMSVLLALLLALTVRTFGFTLLVVQTDAMSDTLQAGDIVLLSRSGEPEAGNIVLAGALNGSALRRVIAEPGDTVFASKGKVYRNGMALYEPYAHGSAQWEMPKTSLQEDIYLIAPDNRAGDGALVRRGGISGVVRAVVWPLRRAGFY